MSKRCVELDELQCSPGRSVSCENEDPNASKYSTDRTSGLYRGYEERQQGTVLVVGVGVLPYYEGDEERRRKIFCSLTCDPNCVRATVRISRHFRT